MRRGFGWKRVREREPREGIRSKTNTNTSARSLVSVTCRYDTDYWNHQDEIFKLFLLALVLLVTLLELSDAYQEHLTAQERGIISYISNLFSPSSDVKEIKNWRSDSCMNDVRSQGKCGSCASFAATAVLEFNTCVLTGKKVKLSEQHLVDCTGDPGSGCFTGTRPDILWNYILSAGGQATINAYPYTGEAVAGACKFSAQMQRGAAVSSLQNSVITISPGDVKTAMDYLDKRMILAASIGPVHPTEGLGSYKKGSVFTGPCNYLAGSGDHGITIVGYGTANGKDVWFIRNSWGTSWGDNGYGMFQRGANVCGIENYMQTVMAGDIVQPVRNWQTGPGGYYKSASNCISAGYRSDSSIPFTATSLDNCAMRCAIAQDCKSFSFTAGNTCTHYSFWSLFVGDPSNVAFAYPTTDSSASTSCGVVLKKWTAEWITEGQSKYFRKCTFVDFDNLQKPSSTIAGASSLTDCNSKCLNSPNDCNHFTLSSTGTCTLMLGQYGSKVKTIYDDSANPNAFCGIIPTRYKPGTLL